MRDRPIGFSNRKSRKVWQNISEGVEPSLRPRRAGRDTQMAYRGVRPYNDTGMDARSILSGKSSSNSAEAITHRDDRRRRGRSPYAGRCGRPTPRTRTSASLIRKGVAACFSLTAVIGQKFLAAMQLLQFVFSISARIVMRIRPNTERGTPHWQCALTNNDKTEKSDGLFC